MKKKPELYRNEIKSYIVRAGMTMSEVVDYLADKYGWSSSVPNLSGKLRRESLRYGEAVELADALGYDIVWVKRGVMRLINEQLEKLKHQKYAAEKKLTAAQHREKRLESEIKRLTRSERTHRLCTRAGMLETFLKEPTVLTDDDVMELLTFIFHSEAVQKKLNLLIKNRENELATDEG